MHLVMFDIDGTLSLTNDASDASFLDALAAELGIEDVDTDWSKYKNVTDQGCLEEIVFAKTGSLPTADECARIRQHYAMLLKARAEADPNLLRPVPGAAEIFESLRVRPGVTLALATGTWRECASIKLRHAGINHAGVAMATSSDSAVREEIMKLSESRARAAAVTNFATRTYVGDALWDLKASQHLSYGFIGVAAGVDSGTDALSQAGAHMVVGNFLEERFELFLTDRWAAGG